MRRPYKESRETDFMIRDGRLRTLAQDMIQPARNPGGDRVGIPIHERNERNDRLSESAENGRGTPAHRVVKRQRFAPTLGKQREKRPKEIDQHTLPRLYYKGATNL